MRFPIHVMIEPGGSKEDPRKSPQNKLEPTSLLLGFILQLNPYL